MKNNLPVTQIEEQYSKTLNILSTTDSKGAISYVNEDFIKISGFEEHELVGQNHNIVRHPDMPPAAFQDLWSTVQTGRSWMGIVKNRCKSGNHYWVDAFVTPIERNGAVTEYQSVRRKPAREYVERAERIYSELSKGKTPSVIKGSLSLPMKIIMCFVISTLFASLSVVFLELNSWASLAVYDVAIIASMAAMLVIFKPYRKLIQQAKKIAENPVATYVYTGRNDDIGQIMLALKMLESETAGVVGRIADSANYLTDSATSLSGAMSQSESGVRHQSSETDQVAAAVNEMSASVQEVASNAQNSSAAASAGLQEVVEGKRVIDDSVLSIQHLKEEIAEAATVIAEVEESSKSISTILDVIGGVAEQTNLLALNAAIEAARAGDAGRGFAVVADEVRSLASRTKSSTEEINQMIERLETCTSKAVEVMKSGQQRTDTCVEQSVRTVDSLSSIHTAIERISDMNTQIASAVEQQSVVADEINRSVHNIRDMSEQSLFAVNSSAKTSEEMLSISARFSELSTQFWTKQSH